ncbi:MAG: hypothetical protein L7S56_07340 [Candidatus Poseidonia sp.]|nr:hypothetical protein [Poseidonia sp.]
MSRRRKARSSRKNRQASGENAQQQLINILRQPNQHPMAVVDSAAVHLAKTSRRHRLGLPRDAKSLLCRKCWSAHSLPGRVRVRVHAGQAVMTCLVCHSIRRVGGGPKHHRTQPENGGDINE